MALAIKLRHHGFKQHKINFTTEAHNTDKTDVHRMDKAMKN